MLSETNVKMSQPSYSKHYQINHLLEYFHVTLTNKKKVKTEKEKMQKPSFQQPVTITFKG